MLLVLAAMVRPSLGLKSMPLLWLVCVVAIVVLAVLVGVFFCDWCYEVLLAASLNTYFDECASKAPTGLSRCRSFLRVADRCRPRHPVVSLSLQVMGEDRDALWVGYILVGGEVVIAFFFLFFVVALSERLQVANCWLIHSKNESIRYSFLSPVAAYIVYYQTSTCSP